MERYSTVAIDNRGACSNQKQRSAWFNRIALLIWLLAGTVAFIPFAFDTSPWDAVTFRVPGNQGNWWHLLVGVPFFLAYPMIWLRLRALFSADSSTVMERRLIWAAVAFSIGGTTLVQAPFLFHLAGTSEWQRLSVLSLGFGIMAASMIVLLLRRRQISPTRACLVGLETAYLANAALSLVVYSAATGSVESRLGWRVSIVIFWPILAELTWILIQSFRTQEPRVTSRVA